MAAADPIRILIVDDETVVRDSLGSWLREEGYSVDLAASGKDALEKLAGGSWDLFILDIKMPGMDGLELQEKILRIHPAAAIIIMTAYASIETAVKAMKQGASDYIVKPFDPEALERLVRSASERQRLRAENILLRRRIDDESAAFEILGADPAVGRIRALAEEAAAAVFPVLITGEIGTGRELVARRIHARSPRRYMPFVIVRTGGIPAHALRGEMAGIERGALADGQPKKRGRLELAAGGTLYIDEVADLDGLAQADLLQVLEDRQILPLGAERPVDIDVRLIAATAADLEERAAKGTFREDLLRKIGILEIHVPPLRDRLEDIPLLAEHFLSKHRKAMNRPIASVTPEALEILRRHQWPRNVRELENTLERSILSCTGSEIRPEDLPPLAAPRIQPPATAAAGPAPESAPDKDRIARCLEESAWNLSQAARLLGMDRVELIRQIQKFGLGRS